MKLMEKGFCIARPSSVIKKIDFMIISDYKLKNKVTIPGIRRCKRYSLYSVTDDGL